MEETNESRINIGDLPQAEQELTSEEARQVQGGLLPAVLTGDNDDATGKKKKPKPSGGGGGGDDAHKGTIEINSWS